MIRASPVVKRQFTRIPSRFRCPCHAPVSWLRTSRLGIRRSRHCPPTPPVLSPLYSASFRAWVCSVSPASPQCTAPPRAQRPHTGMTDGACSDCPSPARCGPFPGSPRPPVSAPPPPSRSWVRRSVASTRRHPSRGANSMNRLLTPAVLVFVIVGHGRPGPQRERLVSLRHQLLAGLVQATPAPRCPRTGGDTPPARPPCRRRTRAQTNPALPCGGRHQHSFSQGLSSFSVSGAPSPR